MRSNQGALIPTIVVKGVGPDKFLLASSLSQQVSIGESSDLCAGSRN